MPSLSCKSLTLVGLAALVAASPEPGFVKHRRGHHVPASSALSTSAYPHGTSWATSSAVPYLASSGAGETTSTYSGTLTASVSLATAAAETATSLAYAPYASSVATAAPATAAPATAAPANASAPANATGAAAPSSIDVTVLQLAFALENLEATFYQQALERFSLDVMVAAGLSQFQAAIVIEQVTQILVDERSHVAVLADTIVALGAQPPFASCGFNFDAALSDPVTFLRTARVLEAVGVSAYLGAAHLLTDPSLLLAASSIVTLEARHQSLLNVLNGGSFNPQAFDIALTPQAVLSLAGPFLTGCDATELGLTANAALTVVDSVTAVAQFVPGSKLAFTLDVEVDVSALTCQLIIGGEPVALTFPAAECVVPAGVNGPVAVYLTNSSTPLATNVVIQAQQTIVAGPGLIFVDAEVTVLASVLSPLVGGGAKHGSSASVDVEVVVGVDSPSSPSNATHGPQEVSTTSESSSSTAAVHSTSSPSESSSSMTTPHSASPTRLRRERRHALPTIQEALGKRRLQS
ncbi:ferritin-like domain-containing protein [Rhodotorula diobovata]|uniref:Ferritin-like domain-containing protein n=1 Tax=Rhodotorula diobovata TaxID=5288 RepID=A0A5C5FZV2_9BASI|nr:ferritin-like domain-containing protein [Rhodotorula diobovata]